MSLEIGIYKLRRSRPASALRIGSETVSPETSVWCTTQVQDQENTRSSVRLTYRMGSSGNSIQVSSLA